MTRKEAALATAEEAVLAAQNAVVTAKDARTAAEEELRAAEDERKEILAKITAANAHGAAVPSVAPSSAESSASIVKAPTTTLASQFW